MTQFLDSIVICRNKISVRTLFCKTHFILKDMKDKTIAIYGFDRFPVSVCEKVGIKRSKKIKGEIYRGYKPSKRGRYFTLDATTELLGSH